MSRGHAKRSRVGAGVKVSYGTSYQRQTVDTSYRHVISYLISYSSIYVVVICSTIHQHALLPYVASFTNISIFYMQHNLLICLAATYSIIYQHTYLPYAAQFINSDKCCTMLTEDICTRYIDFLSCSEGNS